MGEFNSALFKNTFFMSFDLVIENKLEIKLLKSVKNGVLKSVNDKKLWVHIREYL